MSCTTTEHNFPIEKRFWTPEDYDITIKEIRYGYKPDEEIPSFSNPETAIVIKKLVDPENFKVIVNDKELGSKYKNEVLSQYFDEWLDMMKIYTQTDRKDMYVYEKEYLSCWHYGLNLQLDYFGIGIENAKKSFDDPNSYSAKVNSQSNSNIVVKNFLIYLDLINEENSFSNKGKLKMSDGINKYFPILISNFSSATNFFKIEDKTQKLLKKVKSPDIKNSLQNLLVLLEQK